MASTYYILGLVHKVPHAYNAVGCPLAHTSSSEGVLPLPEKAYWRSGPVRVAVCPFLGGYLRRQQNWIVTEFSGNFP